MSTLYLVCGCPDTHQLISIFNGKDDCDYHWIVYRSRTSSVIWKQEPVEMITFTGTVDKEVVCQLNLPVTFDPSSHRHEKMSSGRTFASHCAEVIGTAKREDPLFWYKKPFEHRPSGSVMIPDWTTPEEESYCRTLPFDRVVTIRMYRPKVPGQPDLRGPLDKIETDFLLVSSSYWTPELARSQTHLRFPQYWNFVVHRPTLKRYSTVVTFGIFETLSPQHQTFLHHVSTFGKKVIIVVGKKGRNPEISRKSRLDRLGPPFETRIGDDILGVYSFLRQVDPKTTAICVGYNQDELENDLKSRMVGRDELPTFPIYRIDKY